jgi:hypothetical protein
MLPRGNTHRRPWRRKVLRLFLDLFKPYRLGSLFRLRYLTALIGGFSEFGGFLRRLQPIVGRRSIQYNVLNG